MKSDLYNNQKYIKYLHGRLNSLETILIFKKILKYSNPQPEDKILEIGCNRGETVKEIKKFSKEVIGIDISEKAVKQAVTSNIINMDGSRMDFSSNYFDKIYSSNTIEHIPDLNKFIKEIERVLKPGGKVLLIYPFEILRGSNALASAIFMHKNLSVARELHLHRLTPGRIKKLIAGTSLYHLKSKIHFVPSLSYFTVLEKKI